MKVESLSSKISKRLLKLLGFKNVWINQKKFEKYINKMAIRNAKQYRLKYHFPKNINISEIISNEMPTYIIKKEATDVNNVIIYLHGGAYIRQPNIFHWRFIENLLKEINAEIFFPIYPKGPTHNFLQTYQRLEILYKQIIELYPDKQIIIMGDSAGGGLAIGLSQLIVNNNLKLPKQVIAISPWLDIELQNPEIKNIEDQDYMLGVEGLIKVGKLWANGSNLSDYRLSPINCQTISPIKILLIVGTEEIFLPDCQLFKKNYENQNIQIDYIEYPGMSHDFPLYPIKEAKEVINKIVNYINI